MTQPDPSILPPPASDRTLRHSADLDALRFDDHGLVPVVAQDHATGAVLMVAWADREALEQTLSTREMHYRSRSRGVLWRKGDTSGNVQRLVSLHGDCDGDTVLAIVEPAGPACHTGDATCFGGEADRGFGSEPGPRSLGTVLDTLWATLSARNLQRPEGSHTVRLLSDENLRLKKLGEETAELLTALARGGPQERIVAEGADLLYHLLVALLAAGVTPDELTRELESRRR